MSNVKQCPNGHFYNADENPQSCPWCGAAADGRRFSEEYHDGSPTRPLNYSYGSTTTTVPTDHNPNNGYGSRTVPTNSDGGKTVPSDRSRSQKSDTCGRRNEGVTMRFPNTSSGTDPVVGWLVCKEGVNRGKDYRLRSGFNRIGRSQELDVYISGDDRISRTETASIIYDEQSKQFFITNGASRDLTYLNGKAVIGTQNLDNMDVIAMGNSEFIFVALCGNKFSW